MKEKYKINLKEKIYKYKKFYEENLKIKHIIIFLIMLILFFIMISFYLKNIANLTNTIDIEKISIRGIKEKISLCFIIIFAGISPFVFLSAIGILGSYILAIDIISLYLIDRNIICLIVGSLSSVIQIGAISLCVATGIYYCIQTTKKFRYTQHMSIGFKDIKKAFYEIKKDNQKLEKLLEEEKKKAIKREKLNVKVSYFYFCISFVISVIFILIGELVLFFIK